jgi:excisionase family DNA binding protein
MFENKQLLSVVEVAKAMGITRAAVYKKINKGQIAVQKIGGHVFISFDETTNVKKTRSDIDKGIAKMVKDYGETLKMLGKE